jgi:hypothetical protein
MSEPSLKTIKRLFALSANQCAFPKCTAPIIESSGVVTGKICHIRARNPQGARYDAKQSDEERNAFHNLILLCGRHHDTIDFQPDIYTVDTLVEMKNLHERDGRIEIQPEDSLFAKILLNDFRRINITDNRGTIIIDSPGAVKANTVNIRTGKREVKILPPENTISHDLRLKGYIKYLIDKYNEFASSDPTRQVKFAYGAIYRNIQSNFGVKWELVPKPRFEELANYLQGRINRTRLARINKGKGHRNYRSFDDYCQEKIGI